MAGEEENGGGAAAGGEVTDTGATDTGAADTGTDTGAGDGAADAGTGNDADNQSKTGGEEQTEFAIPEDYKEAKWAEGITNEQDLWKKLANSQELIGKKTITPIDYESASAEDIAAYHKSIVPETPDAYKFSEEADPEFSSAIVPALQEAGIHPAQLKTLEPAINKIASELVGKEHAADRSEDGYFELTEKAFGENHKEVIVQLESAYKDHLSDDTKAFLDNASNSERVAFDQTVKSIIDAKDAQIKKILEEHGVEETGAQTEGETASSKVSIDDKIKSKREEISELEGKAGNKDWKAINAAKDDLRGLYSQKAKTQSKS